MIVLPIRTESPVRLTPYVNYALIVLNVVLFGLLDYSGFGELKELKARLVLRLGEPRLFEFFTYQFLHADILHLAGNMLFLWIFGNSVNAKMGQIPYLLFYLAGGVFAAWGYSLPDESKGANLLGASGSIAAVTTAYLVLFPRCRVRVLYVFFFIGFFELPAMVLIGVKIILWDTIIAPQMSNDGVVAHGAHLAGYIFGFLATLLMVWVRAVGRDHFDLLSLWDRANRRRQWRSVTAQPGVADRLNYGRMARPAGVAETAQEEAHRDRVSQLRETIAGHLNAGNVSAACGVHETLIALDPRQCLSEQQQLRVAREYYRSGRFPQAAAAFERFLEVYVHSTEAADVRLLLGIIYARDLRQYETADRHLSRSLEGLGAGPRRAQCFEWLQSVRSALGRPAPEA